MPEDVTERIKRHEGLRLSPYKDSLGNLTIGYGHLILSGEQFTTLTEPEADELLERDIAQAENEVLTNLPWAKKLPDTVFGVLVEMFFQMGTYRVLQFKNMLRCMSRGNFKDAASAMLASLWAKQTPKRAQELADIVADAATGSNVIPFPAKA